MAIRGLVFFLAQGCPGERKTTASCFLAQMSMSSIQIEGSDDSMLAGPLPKAGSVSALAKASGLHASEEPQSPAGTVTCLDNKQMWWPSHFHRA